MNTTKKFDFNKKISLNFDWWQISWNSWLLLIHEFCEKIWVQTLLKKYIPENRMWNFTHEKQDIVYQKIMRIINWDTSNNNYEFHKTDPTFLDTIRKQIIKIPARIVTTWRQIFYKCASSFVYQEKVL